MGDNLKQLKGKKNNVRRFTGGGPRPDGNEMKAREALERNAAWAALPLAEQLRRLDARLGIGTGAIRQRAKLCAKLEAQVSKAQMLERQAASAKQEAKKERAKKEDAAAPRRNRRK